MKSVKRFVFDTNVLISAVLFPASVPALALKKAFNTGTVVISKACADELSFIALNKKFDKYIPYSLRLAFLIDFENAAEFVQVKRKIEVCRDCKDDKFLALAITAKAKAIITGDKDLLVLNPFGNISISVITPELFLNNY